eukprot:TRINITY_DN10529_c0_g2_i4.p1 TRINITY_DN10529_c0_g2~~TRINITY_DN10529_c0_g2_i4.p1  ORF type:complete len:122 (+),score=7.52 TRINITY_DN10529_c0_g2_i4:50-415(+)
MALSCGCRVCLLQPLPSNTTTPPNTTKVRCSTHVVSYGIPCASCRAKLQVSMAIRVDATLSEHADRRHVDLCTAANHAGGLFGGGYCNALVNAIMKTPNDGATENIVSSCLQGLLACSSKQ